MGQRFRQSPASLRGRQAAPSFALLYSRGGNIARRHAFVQLKDLFAPRSTKSGKQAKMRMMKAVIPAPAWLRKAMDDSLKRRTTPEKALLQTRNMLRQRMQRSAFRPGEFASVH